MKQLNRYLMTVSALAIVIALLMISFLSFEQLRQLVWNVGGFVLGASVLLLFASGVATIQLKRTERRSRFVRRVIQQHGWRFLLWFVGHGLLASTLYLLFAAVVTAFGPTEWVWAVQAGAVVCLLIAIFGVAHDEPPALLAICWRREMKIPSLSFDQFKGWIRQVLVLNARFALATQLDQESDRPIYPATVNLLDRGHHNKQMIHLWETGALRLWGREFGRKLFTLSLVFLLTTALAYPIAALRVYRDRKDRPVLTQPSETAEGGLTRESDVDEIASDGGQQIAGEQSAEAQSTSVAGSTSQVGAGSTEANGNAAGSVVENENTTQTGTSSTDDSHSVEEVGQNSHNSSSANIDDSGTNAAQNANATQPDDSARTNGDASAASESEELNGEEGNGGEGQPDSAEQTAQDLESDGSGNLDENADGQTSDSENATQPSDDDSNGADTEQASQNPDDSTSNDGESTSDNTDGEASDSENAAQPSDDGSNGADMEQASQNPDDSTSNDGENTDDNTEGQPSDSESASEPDSNASDGESASNEQTSNLEDNDLSNNNPQNGEVSSGTGDNQSTSAGDQLGSSPEGQPSIDDVENGVQTDRTTDAPQPGQGGTSGTGEGEAAGSVDPAGAIAADPATVADSGATNDGLEEGIADTDEISTADPSDQPLPPPGAALPPANNSGGADGVIIVEMPSMQPMSDADNQSEDDDVDSAETVAADEGESDVENQSDSAENTPQQYVPNWILRLIELLQ